MKKESNWLVQMRKSLGLTQEDVAKALDVTTRTVINWEGGHNEPRLTLRQTKALCKLLNIEKVSDIPNNFLTADEAEAASNDDHN